MFGFSAFSEAPFSTEQEGQQLVDVVGSEGTLGAGVIGELAIGESGVVSQEAGSGSEDVDQSVNFQAITVTQAIASTASITAASVDSFGNITVATALGSGSGSAAIAVDAGKARKTFTVTVANDGYGNKYYIDGTKQASLSLHEEGIYRFDVSDSSISGHPFNFSTTSNGTHGGGSAYTTGVTTVGTAGQAGAYVEIVVTTATPNLYYYCGIHSGMGGSITFSEQFDQVPFVMVLNVPETTVAAGASASTSFAAITIDTIAGSAGVGASVSVSLTAPNVGVPTSDQSGGASFGATAVAIDITSPVATATAGSAISFSTAVAVEITTAEASVSAGSAQAFVTLIEATTAIAASVSAGSTQPTQFTAPSISTFLSSISAGSASSTDFPALDISTPVLSVSGSSSVDVTHSVSISTPVLVIQTGGSVALTFTGPAINPFAVGIGAGASVDADVATIGDIIGVTQAGVTVTEFPTIDVPIMKVIAPTVDVSGSASVDVTHSVSVILPTVVVKNDITASASGPTDISIGPATGRVLKLDIITTVSTSAATTFTVDDSSRPVLPSSWFNAPVNSAGTWTGGVKLGTQTGTGYGNSVAAGPAFDKDGRIQLKATGTRYYHVRHASDYTTPQNTLRSGRVVHITFVPAESTEFRFWNGSSFDLVNLADFFVGIVHVLNPDALIAGEDTWIHQDEATFLVGWNRISAVYFMDQYSAYKQPDFAIDDSGTYRLVTSVTNSNGETVYQPPPIMNLQDDKLDRLTMFYTGAVADDDHNVNYLPSFMPVHNDGSVGPPLVWFSDHWATIKANSSPSAGARSQNAIASNQATWFGYPFAVQTPTDSNITKTGHYITDHALPILYADARYDSTTARQANAIALFWADSTQFDTLASDSRWKNSWGQSYSSSTFNDADPNTDGWFEHDGSLNQEGRVTTEIGPSSPSVSVSKAPEGNVLDDQIYGLSLLRTLSNVSTDVYQDVGANYAITQNPLLAGSVNDIRRAVTDQSTDASNQHEWFAPHIASGQRVDIGLHTHDRYSENLVANAAYLTSRIDQEVRFPLDSLAITVDSLAVTVLASSNPAVTAINVGVDSAPLANVNITTDTELAGIDVGVPVQDATTSAQRSVDLPEQTVAIAVNVQADQILAINAVGVITIAQAIVETAIVKDVSFPAIDITPVIASREDITEIPSDIALSVIAPLATTSLTTEVALTTADVSQPSTIENPTEFPLSISVDIAAPLSATNAGVSVSVTHSVTISPPIGEGAGPAVPEVDFQSVAIQAPAAETRIINNVTAGTIVVDVPTITTLSTVDADVASPSVGITMPIFRAGISISTGVTPVTVTVDVTNADVFISQTIATPRVGNIGVTPAEPRPVVNGDLVVQAVSVNSIAPQATITQLGQTASTAMTTVTTAIDGAGFVFQSDADLPRIVDIEEENRIIFVPRDNRLTTIAADDRITFIMGG